MHFRDAAQTRALLLLATLTLAAACADGNAGTADTAGAAGAAGTVSPAGTPTGRVINVEVVTVAGSDFAESVRLTGTVSAYRDVTVAAEETGIILALPVAKGSPVSAGQVIARIDDRILQAQVAQARAQADITREVAERRERLFRDSNVGTELGVLEAKSAAQQAAASLEALTQRLNRTVVRAPIPGILDDRQVEIGSMVSMGTPVARIIDVNPAKISAGVPERFAADITPGTRARVTIDALPGRTFDARVDYVGAAVNPRNRTFPIELTLPNPGRAIKPEMVANVDVIKRNVAQAVVVPQEALVRVENGFVAFVVEESGSGPIARARSVVTGAAQRNQVVVQSGLQPGDRLIVVGQQLVANGDRVTVVGGAGVVP
jgi:membrane fusion protein, multidrug efflux system